MIRFMSGVSILAPQTDGERRRWDSKRQLALTPCRLWEVSLAVKKTTSASGVAFPECTTSAGM